MDWRLSSPGACRKHEAVSKGPALCLVCGSHIGCMGKWGDGTALQGSGEAGLELWPGPVWVCWAGCWGCAMLCPIGSLPQPVLQGLSQAWGPGHL